MYMSLILIVNKTNTLCRQYNTPTFPCITYVQVSRSAIASPGFRHSNTPSVISDTEQFNTQDDKSAESASASDFEHLVKQKDSSDYSSEGDHRDTIGTNIVEDEGSKDRIERIERDVTPTPELASNLEPQKEKVDSSASMPKAPSHYGNPTIESPVELTDIPSPHSLPNQDVPISDSPIEKVAGLSQEPSSLSSPHHHHHGFDLPLNKPSRLDSDVETSSVVSVQQLTEAYLNDPFDSAEEMLTVGTNNTSAPVVLPAMVGNDRRSRTPTPSESKSLPKVLPEGFSTKLKAVPYSSLHEPVSSSKLPAHLRPTTVTKVVEKKTLPDYPSLEKTPSSLSSRSSLNDVSPSINNRRSMVQPPREQDTKERNDEPISPGTRNVISEDQSRMVEDQLIQALQAKANLEGQLQSVVDECKNTFKDRATLQSKLGKAEAQLAELSEALERERQKKDSPSSIRSLQSPSENQKDEFEQLKQALKDTKDALHDQKKVASALKSVLGKEKHNSLSLEGELRETQKALNDLEHDLTEKCKVLQSELDKKSDEAEEAQCKSSSLEASYAALEETKGWLHQQLQDSLETKMKLQEELREAKANGIAQCIKAEQLMKENATFQKQIGDLQKGVLQDKARLVSELEAIEADVLSREDSYGHIVAEKGRLEDMVKMKIDALDLLNSELAKAQVTAGELEQKAEDLEMKNDVLSHKVKDLERGKKSLEDKVRMAEQELKAKKADITEMEKVKASLQERIRGSEAGLIGKDGTIQGLNDAREIMRQELEMMKQARENVVQELDNMKLEIARVEDELKTALDRNQEKDALLNAVTQNQRSMVTEKEGLGSQLAEKERELEEKVEELQALESQSGELLGQFKNLQDQFQAIASRSSDVQDGVAENDRVISHLSSEKDNLEEEVASLRDTNEQLQTKLTQLQQEKAHLEGVMETTPSKSLEEFQKSIQDKSQLQAELNSLRMSHQHDLIKAQARANHLESDLKASKRGTTKAQKELNKTLEDHEEEIAKLEYENSHLQSDLRNAKQRLEDSLKTNTGAQQQHASLKQVEGERDRLRAKVDQLSTDNRELNVQLEHEISQKAEIERAGSVVAKNLKQIAKESEKKLQEQIQDMSLQLEKLRGQLAGIEITQSAMREHACGLETALAKREAALVRLSAQAQKVLEEKELEDRDCSNQIESLENQLEDSKKQSKALKEKASEERKRVVELNRELSNRDRELSDLRLTLERRSKSIEDTNSLQESVSELLNEKDRVQTELGRINTQLVMAKTAADVALRELADKDAQVDILTQELEMAKKRELQTEDELRQVRSRLKEADERHTTEVEDLKQSLSQAESQGRESSVAEGVSSGRGLFDSSLSTIGVDETDKPSGEIT